jgi:hypothetical protein
MPPKKSNAEAMRKHRLKIKSNPEAHQVYLMKERERYKRRKQAGKITKITDLPERDQRCLRRKWRKDKQQQRQRRAQKQRLDDSNYTPPPSPNEALVNPTPPTPRTAPPSYQKLVGRKKLRREDKKAYRTIDSQKAAIKRLQTKVRSLRRHIQRLEKESKSSGVTTSTVDSPATKAQTLVNSGNVDLIRKELTFGFALGKQIKENLRQSCRKRKERHLVHRLTSGQILAKYRMLNKTKIDLSLSKKQLKHAKRCAPSSSAVSSNRKENRLGNTATLVKEFYLQDANSEATAGKRDTITVKKDKRQKRYLCDTMWNLYHKFKAENPFVKVSYTSFTRLRPFYVVPPSAHHRDTVRCKMHSNIEFKAKKLHGLGVLTSGNLTNIMSGVVCSLKNEDCMYGRCVICKGNISRIHKDETKTSEEKVKYFEWTKNTEMRSTIKGSIKVNVVSKVEKCDTLGNLCNSFADELAKILPHQYRITHQYNAVRTIKEKLTSSECVLQIDYSENYSCKASQEIQSMHFGGSRRQVTLHTCHATLVHTTGSLYTKCYCTLSEDLRHTPISIWAHLDPVMNDLVQKGVNTLHFVSDGPTTQYRNKTNFYLMATLPFDKWHMSRVTWNFLEASHGKGPADGVGAAVKCAADRIVAHGSDILSCKQLMSSVKDTINVELHEIMTEQIDDVAKKVNTDLPVDCIKGTMQIHQLVMPSTGILYHRKLSCYCDKTPNEDGVCDCHSPVKLEFKQNPVEVDPVVAGLELHLTAEQVHLFEKRFEEGFNVEILDLSTLSSEEKNEYIYWKAWRAAKLRHMTPEEPTMEQEADTNVDDSNDLDWVPEAGHHPSEEMQNSPEKGVILKQNSYYAVFFVSRRKKTFYIGRVIEHENDKQVKMKFLERKLIRSEFVMFDWPRRDDVCTVEVNDLLKEVKFQGPPPFSLKKCQYNEIEQLAKNFCLL